MALIDDGRVVYRKAYGLADIDQKRPLSTDTVMYGASLTKAAFAYMTLQLAEEGVLDLDAPITALLKQPLPEYPDFADLARDSRWRAFTPRMMLSHTTGLINWRFINDPEMLDIKFAPDSRYVYSGEGFQILQLIVEERTGKSTTELMQTRVFDRFDMKNRGMVWRADFAGRTTNRYDASGKALGHNQRRRPRAAGSMDTTLDDYAAFFAGVLRGEGLSARSMDAMLGSQIAVVSPTQFPSHWPGETTLWQGVTLGYGLGWGVYESPQGPAFFKEGSDDGTNNLALGFRNAQHGVLFLCASGNTRGLFLPAVEALYGDTCLPWFWMGFALATVLLRGLPSTGRAQERLELLTLVNNQTRIVEVDATVRGFGAITAIAPIPVDVSLFTPSAFGQMPSGPVAVAGGRYLAWAGDSLKAFDRRARRVRDADPLLPQFPEGGRALFNLSILAADTHQPRLFVGSMDFRGVEFWAIDFRGRPPVRLGLSPDSIVAAAYAAATDEVFYLELGLDTNYLSLTWVVAVNATTGQELRRWKMAGAVTAIRAEPTGRVLWVNDGGIKALDAVTGAVLSASDQFNAELATFDAERGLLLVRQGDFLVAVDPRRLTELGRARVAFTPPDPGMDRDAQTLPGVG